jgi:hypothetical protein
MSYFIFLPNLDNQGGSLYRIAENESDLNNLNILQSDYKIIEDTQSNFDFVKYGTKLAKYNNDTIIYTDQTISFASREQLQQYIIFTINVIKQFTNNNPNHPLFNLWNDYINQLNTLNFSSITFPLNKSLEQYFKDQNQTSLSPLQLP